jgi:hypothetical protein
MHGNTRSDTTRRRFLKLTGVGVAGPGLTGVPLPTAGERQTDWTTVESPTEKTLYDVVMSSEGPYAVGGGGDVLARRADGWERVLEKGPTTESNPLRGADVTDDGRNVWFAGGSGVVAHYDVVDEQLVDYSAPKGKTSSWLDVAVTGQAGAERVYLVNGSGEFLPGRKTDAGEMNWGDITKPGGGSSAPGVDFYTDTAGVVCDTNAKVYRTRDAGGSFSTIGIEGGSVNLYDVASLRESEVNVAGGSGWIFYSVEDEGFSAVDVGSNAVRSIERDGATGWAAGASGLVYEREGVGEWTQVETPTSNTLHGVAIGASDSDRDVVVGSSGTILERGATQETVTTGTASGEELSDEPWVEADSPTGKTLNGIVESTDGPYAVGGGGRVLARRPDSWTVVIENGPKGQGNTLNGAAVTDDGVNVWFAGSSGVIGQYDVEAGELADHSAPKGKTSSWEDVTVTGPAGSESVYLVNGSGEVLSGQNDGGEVTWGEVLKPGGGSSMKGVAFIGNNTGYICDTNAKVYETTNGGDSYETIGIEGGSVGLYGVDAVSPDEVNVVGGDGSIFRYNGAVWTKLAVTGNSLAGIDRMDDHGLACGGSGTIAERTADGWKVAETPTGNGLQSIVIGTTYPDVAVGGSGTILERGTIQETATTVEKTTNETTKAETETTATTETTTATTETTTATTETTTTETTTESTTTTTQSSNWRTILPEIVNL